jgi:hypothetical protein
MSRRLNPKDVLRIAVLALDSKGGKSRLHCSQ